MFRAPAQNGRSKMAEVSCAFIHHIHMDCNATCLSPKILHNLLSLISLGMTVIPRRNWKQWHMHNVFLAGEGGGEGGDKVHYGLCENIC